MQELITISGKQYAGKDLLAGLLLGKLSDKGFRKVPIAMGIKEEFAHLYGMTPHAIEAEKSLYRPGLIALGQRRRLAEPDYWLERVMSFPGPKIVSDVRLLHEYEFFKKQGAYMIRLNADEAVRAQRGTIVSANDPTECELDQVEVWDAVLINNATVDALRLDLEQVLTAFTVA